MDIQVDPKLFHDFHFKMAMSLRLPDTSRKILDEFVDVDVNAEAVSKIIQRNQYFEYMLLHEIRSLGLKENTPKLTAAIALLGMQRVRDFVCALQIVRRVGRRHLEVGKDGKLSFKASDHLKYALKSEEFVSVHKLQYGDTAYAAGLMFDLMVAVGHELYEGTKAFDEFVAETFKHGLKTARIGVELAKTLKSFSYTKYVFAGCLIHDIGKIAMDLLYPAGGENAYQAFLTDIGKKPLRREVIHFVETKRFGLTHEYYTSQLAYYFGVFRPIEKPLLFHHDPYIIKSGNKDMYNLAAVIAMASNMANNTRIPKDSNDPIYKAWNTHELRDFKIDPKLQSTIMSRAAAERY